MIMKSNCPVGFEIMSPFQPSSTFQAISSTFRISSTKPSRMGLLAAPLSCNFANFEIISTTTGSWIRSRLRRDRFQQPVVVEIISKKFGKLHDKGAVSNPIRPAFVDKVQNCQHFFQFSIDSWPHGASCSRSRRTERMRIAKPSTFVAFEAAPPPCRAGSDSSATVRT